MRVGKVVLAVMGGLLGIVGLALMVGGGALLWAFTVFPTPPKDA